MLLPPGAAPKDQWWSNPAYRDDAQSHNWWQRGLKLRYTLRPVQPPNHVSQFKITITVHASLLLFSQLKCEVGSQLPASLMESQSRTLTSIRNYLEWLNNSVNLDQPPPVHPQVCSAGGGRLPPVPQNTDSEIGPWMSATVGLVLTVSDTMDSRFPFSSVVLHPPEIAWESTVNSNTGLILMQIRTIRNTGQTLSCIDSNWALFNLASRIWGTGKSASCISTLRWRVVALT